MTTMEHKLRGIEERLAPAECRTAQKVLDQARKLLAAPPQLPALPSDPFTSGTVTEAYITAAIERVDAEARMQRRRAVLMELIEGARARSASAAAEVRDQVLHGYNRELTLLLDDVRELAAELQGVDSAEAAVASDLGPAWKRLAGLSDDYSVLRAAQRKLMDPDVVTRARPTVGGEEHASDLFLANLDTIWPEWRSGEGLHGVVVTNVNGAPARYEPWPSQQPQLLLWLATSAAEPWVPTHGQLQQLWAQRAKKANPMPRQSGGPVQQPNLYGRVTARVETARI